MELTGKAEKDFEKWYRECINAIQLNSIEFSGDGLGFYDLPNSMQYGVLVDFFLEKTKRDLDKSTVYYTKGYGKEKARVKAIEEENEIYNEKHT